MKDTKPVWLINRTAFGDSQGPDIEKELKRIGVDYVNGAYSVEEKAVKIFWDRSKYNGLPDCPIIPVGSIQFVEFISDMVEGACVWVDWRAFACTGYYNVFGKYLLNQDYLMLTVGEAARKENFIYGILGKGEVFIRPNDNKKSFDGQVVKRENFQAFTLDLESKLWHDSILVFAAKEKINAEYRIVVNSRHGYVCGSRYMKDGEVWIDPEVPESVKEYAENLAASSAERGLPHMICYDIADTPKGLKLIEISCVNTAGLYDFDVPAYVSAMNECAMYETKT